MAKSYNLCDAALADVKAFAAPKLIIITGYTDARDPSTWTEAADYDLDARLSLAGELDNAISTVGGLRQFTFPEVNKDLPAVANVFTSKCIGIADIGTGALQASTPARIILDTDFADRTWAVGEIPRLAAGAYTCAEG